MDYCFEFLTLLFVEERGGLVSGYRLHLIYVRLGLNAPVTGLRRAVILCEAIYRGDDGRVSDGKHRISLGPRDRSPSGPLFSPLQPDNAQTYTVSLHLQSYGPYKQENGYEKIKKGYTYESSVSHNKTQLHLADLKRN
jgi:hypothetical protein